MKRLLIGLLVLNSVSTFANNSPRVAVFDMPTNVNHSLLKPFLDSKFMETQFVSVANRTMNLKELNSFCLDEIHESFKKKYKHFDKGRDLALTFFGENLKNTTNYEDKNVGQIIGAALGLLSHSLLPNISDSSKRVLDAMSAYIGLSHGTSVSHAVGIAGEGKVKVVPFPMDCGQHTINLQKDFGNIIAGNFVAGNFSIGIFEKKLIQSRRKQKKLIGRLTFSKKDKHEAMSATKDLFHMVEELVQTNQDILFVFGSGNDKSSLEKQKMDFAEISSENMLFVSSVKNESSQKLSKFSNFSNQQVEIAACGESLSLASFEGDQQDSTGTSFSSPITTGRIALFSKRNKAVETPKDLKEAFLTSSNVIQVDSLNDKVKNGNVLHFCPKGL